MKQIIHINHLFQSFYLSFYFIASVHFFIDMFFFFFIIGNDQTKISLFCFPSFNEALKRLEEGFVFEHNVGLCGVGFSSLKACTASDHANLTRPEPYGAGVGGLFLRNLFCFAFVACFVSSHFHHLQTCVLKVNIHCDGCKQKVKKLLQRIEGAPFLFTSLVSHILSCPYYSLTMLILVYIIISTFPCFSWL